MFIAALHTTAKTSKQLNCPSTDEWIKKMWYRYTMEYYLAIKKSETPPSAVTRMKNESESHKVVSDSLPPQGLNSPWNSSGQNTGVGNYPFSSGSSQPRDGTQVSWIASGFFNSWATREAHSYTMEYCSAIKKEWTNKFKNKIKLKKKRIRMKQKGIK